MNAEKTGIEIAIEETIRSAQQLREVGMKLGVISPELFFGDDEQTKFRITRARMCRHSPHMS